MDIIILILELAIIFILIFGKSYFSRKGENAALIEDSRDISYESKKGENLATKEDIEELTRKIENVKNDISFESQRKHDFINQRTRRLLNILYQTEKLNEYQSTLLFSLYEKNSSERLNSLIEQIGNTLLDFVHECRIVTVTINDKDLSTIIYDLMQKAQEYANYMCYIASNGANQMNAWATTFEVGIEKNNSEILKSSLNFQNSIEKIREDFEKNIDKTREPLYNLQIKYLAKLNFLFDSDFHIKS